MYEGIVQAHEKLQPVLDLIDKMVEEIGKPKFEYEHADFDEELFNKIVESTMDEAMAAMDTDDKIHPRGALEQAHRATGTSFIWPTIRRWTSTSRRSPISPEEDRQEVAARGPPRRRPRDERDPPAGGGGRRHPRVHGSGLFTRGQTQVLSMHATSTPSPCPEARHHWEEEEKRFMHHYNFPGYSHRRGQAPAQHRPPRVRPRPRWPRRPSSPSSPALRTSPTPSAW